MRIQIRLVGDSKSSITRQTKAYVKRWKELNPVLVKFKKTAWRQGASIYTQEIERDLVLIKKVKGWEWIPKYVRV